jgi:hypothetical protein
MRSQRAAVWAAGYGGTATTGGNASVGSSRVGGVVAGGLAYGSQNVTANRTLGFGVDPIDVLNPRLASLIRQP